MPWTYGKLVSYMQAKISNSLIPKLKAEAKPYEVHDTEDMGFLLRVQPSGVIAYYCSYRNQAQKRNRLLLGRHPTVTPAQARGKARTILASVVMGSDPIKEKSEQRTKVVHTLKSFIDDHYATWAKANHVDGPATIARITTACAELLALPLADIDTLRVEKWRNKRAATGVAASTINRDLTALKAAMARAVDWGLLEAHSLAKVKPAKIDAGKVVRYLSQEEEGRLTRALDEREEKNRQERDAANKWRAARGYSLYPDLRTLPYADHLRPMVIVSVNTGLRQGELFNLKWADIDFEQSNLTIHGHNAKSGKTRHIPLNSVALETLKHWKTQQVDITGLVFPSTDGKPFDNVNRSWHGVLAQAGIANFRWHDLRHSFASKLVMKGVDLNTVRELLGHADLKMTLRYAHLAPEHKAAAVAKLC